MRVATVIPTWLIISFLTALAMGGPASADILEVEPDLFPEELTVLDDKFPGVTLSNVTDANEKRILVRGVGTDIPMTGQYVFGRETTTSGQARSLRLFGDWLDDREDPDAAKLRADFVRAVDFVSIQASTGDNGGYRLEAFDASDNLLAHDNPQGAGTVLNASIDRRSEPSPDIAYILAWGVAEQDVSGPTDNLQVNFDILPVFINIKPDDDQNRINICAKRTLPVAILSFPKFSGGLFFDAKDIDPFSVDLEGAGVKTVGKNPERAKFQLQDVNGDGHTDMVVEIETKQLEGIDPNTADMTLTGRRSSDNNLFTGKDAVDITQFMCLRSVNDG